MSIIAQQGIFKPAILELPLSITTAPPKPGKPPPYSDGLDADGLLNYRYRGTNPDHRDNVGLRRAMHARVPLVYFFGVEVGQYMPVWPVYLVGDAPSDLTFKVAVDEQRFESAEPKPADRVAEGRRSYVTVLTVRRLHQAAFRQRVLRAYRERCSVCRLRQVELLDAAHIIPDGHPRGEPIVPNGLALCTLHHSAFDRHILGVRPDLVIEIRRDILDATDGPMLRHGLQDVAGSRIETPRDAGLRPRADLLEERYALFRRAG